MRKILHTTDFGAGWSTWTSDINMKRFMATYKPIISHIEQHGDSCDLQLTSEAVSLYVNIEAKDLVKTQYKKYFHPVVFQFMKDCFDKFKSIPYLGGIHNLDVFSTNKKVHITEYDGSESIEEYGNDKDWI